MTYKGRQLQRKKKITTSESKTDIKKIHGKSILYEVEIKIIQYQTFKVHNFVPKEELCPPKFMFNAATQVAAGSD